jgi:predicted transposase/invertase (TIGR01784 family)
MCERYLNPFVDYGFKKLFGTEENKDLLISLLNALLCREDPITDLTYKNVEQIGEINGTRTNYFDVYCTTANGEEFIVEMQNSWQPFFKERMLYYASKLIRNQGKKGIQKALDDAFNPLEALEHGIIFGKDPDMDQNEKKRNKGWDGRLNDVYVIAMMNFKLPNKEYADESFIHKIQLMDVNDLRVFYDKLTLIYVELPKVDKVKLDLNTPQGKWMHALNNLYFYDQKPSELKEPVFDKLFRQAELAQLTPEQDMDYERSMKVYLDTYNQLKGAHILGEKEGLAKGEKIGLAKGEKIGLEKGKEIGLAEGKTKANLETARRMLDLGIDTDTICKATGLSKEEIADLV